MARQRTSRPSVADAAPLLSLPDAAPAVLPASSLEGHRARLRQRFLTAGANALADHEMLEIILHIAIPRRDTKPIARAIIARFGTYSAAISAPAGQLREIEGLGDAGIAALKVVQAAAQRLVQKEVMSQPILNNWQALIDYLTAAVAREKTEHVRVLFLDTRNRLLADEIQSTGTVNHAPLYPREVIKRALALNATALVLVHNHPSGDPTPSDADVETTREVADACRVFNIVLHDHVIVGNGTWASLRQRGLL